MLAFSSLKLSINATDTRCMHDLKDLLSFMREDNRSIFNITLLAIREESGLLSELLGGL